MDWYADYLASTLKQHSVTGRINFKYKHYRIAYSDYCLIGDMIIDGEIAVKRADLVGGKGARRAQYNSKSNVMTYKASLYKAAPHLSLISGIQEISTWVHEATHAIQDLNDWRITVGDAEIMAHVAQAIYLVWISEDQLFNDKLRAAGPLAKKISDHDKSTRPDGSELEALKDELRKVSTYKKNWDHMRNYANDGSKWL